jgi:predicted ester cyclase
MSSEDIKAVVNQFVTEVQNQGNLDVIDTLLADDFVDHSAPAGLPDTRQGVKMQFATMLAAFPDMRAVVHDQLTDGDKVITRKTLHMTHLDNFMGIAPTGKAVELKVIEVIDIVRVVNGKIVEHWNCTDRLGLMQQLGVMPVAA